MMHDGIWIGGDYIPCCKVTTYFCSFEKDRYYYGGGGNYSLQLIPPWEKIGSFDPMHNAAPVILAFWDAADD